MSSLVGLVRHGIETGKGEKSMAEYWDLYDEKRNPTGKIHRRGTPIPKGYYHVVANAWVKNEEGRYLLSRRHPDRSYPLLWEPSGGRVIKGETSMQGILREVQEELGITLPAHKGKLVLSLCKNEYALFHDIWAFSYDVPLEELDIQQNEVAEVAWFTPEEIRQLDVDGLLVPTQRHYEEIFWFFNKR